ncbi:DUF1631 family protein [Corticibacter populi]|uniref:DUF1631 family protein n=1 Tax=Corticibacter populi TaxID=1550736 RepID=UPI0010F30AB2|nr:DUF1631 family protein [Corticibacter populi]RZS36124.1 uncharacterized protein DUF1631 [Corticibacter populi]
MTTNQNGRNRDILKNSIASTIRESDGLIRRVLRETGVRLAEHNQGAVERSATAMQALRLLDSCYEIWVRQYPAYLLRAFSEVTDFDPFSQEEGVASGLGTLGLGDELSIQGRSELTHMQRTLDASVESAQDKLDALVSAARGYAYVRPGRNPLRAENYLLAAQKLIYQSEAPEPVRLLLLRNLTTALAPALARTYQVAANTLSEAGVEAVQKRSTGFGALSTGLGSIANFSVDPDTAPDALLTQEELLRLLGNDVVHAIVAPSAAAHAPANPPGSEPADGWTLDRLLAQTGRAVAHLPPVKALLAQWQPALRTIVQNDPAFLRDAAHPARQWLDWLAQSAGGFASVAAGGFTPYLTQLQHVSAHFGLAQALSGQAFENARAALTVAGADSVAKEETVTATQPEVKQQELSPQQLLEVVMARIEALPVYAATHPRVQKFVMDSWARVIVRSILRQVRRHPSASSIDAQEWVDRDPSGYLALVPLMLASVQSDHWVDADDAELQDAVEHMWSQVQQGLQSVGLSSEKVVAAVDKLRNLHQQARQLAADAPSDGDAEPAGAHGSGQMPLSSSAFPTQQPVPAPLPAGEREAPGGGANHSSASVAAAQASTASFAARPDASTAADSSLDMRVGAWFMVGEHSKAVRTCLSWASPDGTVFMFTSADGSNQTMTRRRLLQLHQAGQLQPA